METVDTPDGLALVLHHWPLAGASRRVLIVHGLGEHAGRYQAVAAALNGAGYAVSAHDQRGHGHSPGRRGAIPAPDSLCADLACVVDRLQGLDGRPPLLLGHSLGGLVAARFVAEELVARPAPWRRAVPALVLSSPAIDPGMSVAQHSLLALLGRLAPGLAVGNGLSPDWLSHDPAVVQAYRVDPLVHDRVTARLVRFIVDAGAQVRRLAPFWRTPTLLLWAGADRCVAPAGSAAFAAAAPAEVVRHQAWPALRHEIFNEPERDQVLARVLDFLAQQPA
jgi:alpha-beta hydrolase superfamily lysophospholipase